jgi:CheY-like chemotaxis protein
MLFTAYRYGIGVAFIAALLSQAPAQDDRQPPKNGAPPKGEAPKNGQPPKEEAPKKEKAKKGDKAEDKQKKDDNYRQFFRQPESVEDYWRALSFELEVGRPDLAAQHLQGLMSKNPTDAELVELEEEQGMTNILRLRYVRKWDDDAKLNKQALANVGKLIQLTTTALEKHLSDKDRIAKFVKNLASGEPEERAFALKELHRSGARMIPAFVDRLRDAKDEERVNLTTTLPKLGEDTVPPLIAALDIDDRELRTDIIENFEKRAERGTVPFLWHFAGSEKVASEVRSKAREAIAYLLRTTPDQLPAAKVMLTEEAEKYYKHQIPFPDPRRVTVWRWDGKDLVSSTMPATRAEEYYGLLFARAALDLDPTYKPAQVVFLSLALEKAAEPLGNDQPLTKGAPAISELLATVNPELITAVLERALKEHRTGVILGAVRALGALADVRALRPSATEEPALLKALKYPDRRVQLVAADALLRIPGTPSAPAKTRIVEVLRRTAAAAPVSKVLIADGNRERGMLVADAVRKAGFEPVTAVTGRDALRAVHEAADIDAIVIDQGILDPQLPHLIGQLRADLDAGAIPILITESPTTEERQAALDSSPAGLHRRRLADEAQSRRQIAFDQADDSLRALAKQYQRVDVIQATTDVNKLKGLLGELIGSEMGRPFTQAEQGDPSAATADRLKRLVAERKDHADRALVWLSRLATGEIAGYDVKPAADSLIASLRFATHGAEATRAVIDAVGRLPGPKPQIALADFVLDAKRTPAQRAAAASQLIRHIQQHGALLSTAQAQSLEALARAPDTDPGLKSSATLVIGTLRPDTRTTGERLKGYTPAPAPPMAKEKE